MRGCMATHIVLTLGRETQQPQHTAGHALQNGCPGGKRVGVVLVKLIATAVDHTVFRQTQRGARGGGGWRGRGHLAWRKCGVMQRCQVPVPTICRYTWRLRRRRGGHSWRGWCGCSVPVCNAASLLQLVLPAGHVLLLLLCQGRLLQQFGVCLLVVVNKVAVRHEGQGLAVAVTALRRCHHCVVDQPRQEWCAGSGRKAHI
mmetsp:Transcript_5469/g.14777  ORF Transcript_5469/g.14777 Transcript_5469/m.14777 type:complete len:201 (+) Transcript_5469:1260-1862(+)